MVPAAGLLLATTVACGLFLANGLALTPESTAWISAALLVFGLPHGAFDIALLQRTRSAEPQAATTLALVAGYLLCAASTYLAWRTAPALALAAFLLLAMVHFAEDWQRCGSRFIALGVAGALVSAPAVLHSASLAELFVSLTGDPTAAMLADMLMLVAPTAIAIATVGTFMLHRAGQQTLAVALACSVAAMMLLPPVAGFALFFCLVHSPLQFGHHAQSLGLNGFRQWGKVVIPLSLGGLGIAALLFALNDGLTIAANVFATSFMTLAVLTVPHMVVPAVADRLLGRNGRAPASA